MITVLTIVLAVVGLVLALFASAKLRLFILTQSTVFLMFLGWGGVSYSGWWSFATLPAALSESRDMLKRSFIKIALAIAIVIGIATLWSSAPIEGWNQVARTIAFVSAFGMAMRVLRTHGANGLTSVLGAFALVCLIEATTVILFNVSPSTEQSYYASPLARTLLGSGVDGLYTDWDSRNNVIELSRAGGFMFLSVNRAALFLGVSALTFAAYSLYSKKKWPVWIAAYLAVSVVFTGSKTGLALLVVLPLFALMLASAAAAKNASRLMAILLQVVIALGILVQLFALIGGQFIAASTESLGPRLVLWGEAIRVGLESPFGIGFGAWDLHWALAASDVSQLKYPPHNFFLFDWLNGGIFLLLLDVVFVIAIVRFFFKATRDASSRNLRLSSALGLAAFMWTFIHGLGDNTELLGTAQTGPLLAILIAMAAFSRENPALEPELPTTERRIIVTR